MNKAILIGRVCQNIELKYTNSNKPIAKFSLAINRTFKNFDGEYETDFINCVAFDKRAETLSQYVKKGDKLGIEGSIRVSSYDDKDGNKRYNTDIFIDGFEFLNAKDSNSQTSSQVVHKVESDPFAEFGSTVELNDNFLE